MTFAFLERAYGHPFRRGQRVLALGRPGVVTSATLYVHVRLDGEHRASAYHPTDVRPEETGDERRTA
jgi:hypothetical protein